MKHKHAELIKAWADGAKIQYFSGLGYWNDIDYPGWLPTEEYRIKPDPRPQWQQDLIDAAKMGKVVEYIVPLSRHWGWLRVNDISENFIFGNESGKYRILPEKVIRYLWAYKNIKNDWFVHQRFETESEAAYTAKKNQFMFKRLDYTATEFEE